MLCINYCLWRSCTLENKSPGKYATFFVTSILSVVHFKKSSHFDRKTIYGLEGGGGEKQKIFNIMFSLVKNIYRFMNLRNVHHSVARNENLL